MPCVQQILLLPQTAEWSYVRHAVMPTVAIALPTAINRSNLMRAYENLDGSWDLMDSDPEKVTPAVHYASFNQIPEPVRSRIAYLKSFTDPTEWITGFGKKIGAGVFWLESGIPSLAMYEQLAARGLIAIGVPDKVYILFVDGQIDSVFRSHDQAYESLLDHQEAGKRASIVIRTVKGDV